MTPWKPYVWKELHQSRRVALGALAVLLAISFIPSIIASIRSQGHWYNGNPLAAMFLAGPIVAVIVGVYAMGREQGEIERFWRSRPVNLNLWLLSKYVTGLVVVWLVCWTPIAIRMLGRTFEPPDESVHESIGMPLAYSFILLLIYSASFALGQLIRGVLHAAILAVAAMALIFIMPLVIAPLNWLSLEVLQRTDFGAMDLPSYATFAVSMTGLSIVLLCLSGILLKRGIRVDADQRTLSWSVVVILLALAAGVAFPMGTNVSPQQVIPLPVTQNGMVSDMAAHGNDLLIVLSGGPERSSSKDRTYGLVRVHVGEQTSVADEPLWFAAPEREQGYYYTAHDLVWSTENPSLAYTIVRRTKVQDKTIAERTHTLYTIALDAKQSDPVVHRVELNPLLDAEDGVLTLGLYRERLYVCCDHGNVRLLTFSLANPQAPSLIRSEDLEHPIGFAGPGTFRSAYGPWRSSLERYQVQLVPCPDLDASARLEVTHQLAPGFWTLAGHNRILASAPDSGEMAMRLVLFETEAVDSNTLPLSPVAQRRRGALERTLRMHFGVDLCVSDHLAYNLTGMFGATVYDIGNPGQIKRVGHYAAGEGFSSIVSLPDDRVVIAGGKLHVLDLSGRLSH
jgi:hypothetical protein